MRPRGRAGAAARGADPVAALTALADPADAGAQNNLGVALARHGRTAEAQRAFGRALALDPAMMLARRNLAAASTPEGDAAAEWALRARVHSAPGDPEAWRALARHLSARSRHDAARDVLARWSAGAPDASAPAAERARVELAAGCPEAALEAVAAARAAAPPEAHPALDVLAARAVYQQGDAPAALALLDRAHAAAPDDADAALLRSFVLGEAGAAAEAAAARARATALNPALGAADENLALADAGTPGVTPDTGFAPSASDGAAPTAAGALALARAHRRKGYVAEAADALARARAAVAGDADPALARELGEVLLLTNRPAEALEVWEGVVSAGGDAAAWLNLGVARALGGARGAGDAFARAAALGRGTCAEAWALAGQAHVARGEGDLAAAGEALRAAAAAAREATPAPRAALAALLARTLAGAGRFGEARRAGAAAERLAPGWAHAALAHGEVLAAAGAHAEARQAYARAVALSPDDAAGRYGLAFAAAACGDHAAARAETARALALAAVVPSLPWPLVADVGEWLVCGAGAGAAAAPGARPLAAADAGVADARLAALFGEGPGGADVLVPNGTVLVPGAARGPAPAAADAGDAGAPSAAPFADADALLAVGEYDRAVAALSRATARGADRAAALARAGLAFERQGFFGEALDRYAQAADPAVAGTSDDRPPVPAAADPHRGRARMLAALGRWDAAYDAARDAVHRTPAEPRAHALVASAAARCGDETAARDAAHEAERLAAAPASATAASADVWTDIAAAWRAVDDPAREVAARARAAECAPADVASQLAHADALTRAGQADDARRVLEALVRERPTAAEPAVALARLLAAAGDHDGAATILADVAVRDPWHADALAELAAALVDTGRADEAATVAERALRLDRDHALANAAAAAVALAAGHPARAAGHARRAIDLEPAGAGARRARALRPALDAIAAPGDA